MNGDDMKLNFRHTITACFVGYIIQAIINNFAPLLFLTFQSSYGIPLSRITLLITFNFVIQLAVDLAAAGLADKLGTRALMITAHVCCAAGLILMAVLPEIIAPFAGLLIAVTLYAVGGGLLEVLVSPVVEACPTENKEKQMSLLHSFYCWGQVGVILLSTLFFTFFGIENWRVLALIWAAVPMVNAVIFALVPIKTLVEKGESMKFGQLAKSGLFRALFVMMLCAGACEMAVSQWASTLAEAALGVSKAVGDLAGPMMFAVLMGTARALYGKFADRISIDKAMPATAALCAAAYLCIALVPNAVTAFVGCGICGFSVGIMWPGTFSKSAAALPKGGTMMFALLALAGDVGCSGGPTLAGFAADAAGGNLKVGVLCGVIFPVVMLIASIAAARKKRNDR